MILRTICARLCQHRQAINPQSGGNGSRFARHRQLGDIRRNPPRLTIGICEQQSGTYEQRFQHRYAVLEGLGCHMLNCGCQNSPGSFATLRSEFYQMTHRESIIATLLVAFSALVGVGIVEAGCRIYGLAFPRLYDWNRRIRFFDGPDSIFRNTGQIFTYVPNSYIFSRAIYFSNSSYSTEYAYGFKTNNFGLVQDTDLVRGAKSVLLLGDSFTEGQGAEPWFRKIAPLFERLNYQPINGGILATGFPNWWELEQLLSANKIALAKLIIIFISDDFHREKLNWSKDELDCLRSIGLCLGTEEFFRLPPASELPQWVAKIRMTREPDDASIKGRIKSVLPATYAVYRFLRQTPRAPPQTDLGTKMVETFINKMVEKYGRENVLFIQLPQKDELGGTILPDGLLTRKLIRNVGARFADGTSLCGLNKSDFFVRDGHPNQQGYSKIAKCMEQIIEPFLTQVD